MKLKNKLKILILLLAAIMVLPSNSYGQTTTDLPSVNVPNNTDTIIPNSSEGEKQLSPETDITTSSTPTTENDGIDTVDSKEVTDTGTIDSKDPNKTETSNKTLSGRAVIVDLASDKLEYFQDEDTFVATGSAKVIVAEQNAELEADKVVYHQKDEFITAEGNIKIKKDGKIILGDFARIDLNKQSALISNPNTVISKVRMNAKEANLYPEYIELKEGNAIIDQENIDLSLTASEYKPKELKSSIPIPGHGTVIPENMQDKKPNYRIIAKEIELDRSKKTNNLIIRNAKVYIGKVRVAALPRMTLTIGENAKAIEAVLPEVGFDKNIGGIYFGPSLTLNLPKNSYLRVSPIVSAFGSENYIGGGGVAHFRSGINQTDIAYTTTGNRLVVRGEQKIYKDTTKIKYSVNEYPDDGFMGTGLYRPLYLVEMVDERKIGKLLNHNIFTRASGGIARDVNDGIATPRIQLQGNIISDKPILHFKDFVALRLQSQFNVAAYGTGDTYAVVRGGPRIDWNLWRLNLTTTYMQAGVWGNTPFIFDEFIRGSRNLILAGDFKVSKFLSVGNIRSLNLAKDGSEPYFSTENQFYARVGPEDFKFRIGYDVVRKRSIFGLDLFLGSGRSALSFDKLKILHPEMDIK